MEKRTNNLNKKPVKIGKYILYWMQAAQRAEYNHALEYSIETANKLNRPLVVVFGLMDDYPEANLRHYYFMLQGLQETKQSLEKRGIQIVTIHDEPDAAAIRLSKEACTVIVDSGQLKIQRRWRQNAAKKMDCLLQQVETNLIVPVTQASDKENFSAGVFRPRIKQRLKQYMKKLTHKNIKRDSLGLKFQGFNISSIDKALSELKVDKSVPAVADFTGGTSQAKKRLTEFIKNKLKDYDKLHSDPSLDYQSNMSPYLHFGQISSLYIALKVQQSGIKGKEAFLEELIVRRELSHNFVYYNEDYDNFNCLPRWAVETLNRHQKDKRKYIYSFKELEQGRTHDAYWNAAQMQMVQSGKMHGYMRMYWGKKILEWSANARVAFETALKLNNKYELDGRDANAFAGIAWCFGKHDRAWNERKIFGKVRYMNEAGLKRKFDMDKYINRYSGEKHK